MKRLWDYLNADVSTLLSRGESDGVVTTRVQELIDSARSEAARRELPVEDVLRERGHLPPIARAIPVGSVAQPNPARRQNTGAYPAIGPTPLVERRRSQRPAIPQATPFAAWTPLNELLRPLTDDEVEVLLKYTIADDRFLSRLHFLNAIDENQFRRAGQLKGAEAICEAIGQFGVPAEVLADLMTINPGCPPFATNGERFFDYLLENDHLHFKAYRAAQRQAQAAGEPLLPRLLAGVISGERYTELVAEFSGIEPISALPSADNIDASFPREWVRLFDLVPISVEPNRILIAAPYAVPLRLRVQLEAALDRKIEIQLAPLATLTPTIDAYLHAWSTGSALSEDDVHDQRSERLGHLITAQRGVQLVDQIFAEAFNYRATDIHFEPADDHARVRYRVDGICHEVVRLPPVLAAEVVGRVKVLAGMDVTERRRPQDGHIKFVQSDAERDLRIATIPTRFGEKVSVRVANTGQINTNLDALGLTPKLLGDLRSEISRPYGMVLATGPVGSGKTTTLYSCLNEFDRTKYHVMTIEDPVEIELPGVNQVQVNTSVGMDVASGLRALLRQDPDKVLIGEIRDEETARIAVRASMTGLMVFSTLHANDSTGAITTLRNFGIPSFLIASSLRAVVAQRLLRRVCPHCKQRAPLDEIDPHTLGLAEWPDDFVSFQGRGCDACFGTGYLGRTGIFELFTIDNTVRDMIFDDASTKALRTYALGQGMKHLGEDAHSKIMQGVTTIEEFNRMLRF